MIMGITGKLSGGKTISMVKFAYDEYLNGKKVIANFKIDFKDNKRVFFISNEKLIELIKHNYTDQEFLKKTFSNSCLLLDEIGFLVNARSRGNLNELITGFMMMLGKLNCNLYYTAQIDSSQTDIRLREICNIVCNTYRVKRSNMQPLLFEDRKVNYKILIIVVIELDLDLLGKKVKKIIFDPEPYYSMYNTEEITILDRSLYLSGGLKDLRKW